MDALWIVIITDTWTTKIVWKWLI